jgi:ribosome-associated translation inhibitor RaiA
MVSNAAAPALVVHGHGRVSHAAHSYAHQKISALMKFAGAPILFAKVDLIAHADPARERGALAKAEFDVNGSVVRAHAEGTTMHAAIDALESRLGTRLKRAGAMRTRR